MEAVCSKSQNSFISQVKSNKFIQYYKVCETCRPIKTNINVDCITYDNFDKIMTDLHQAFETINKV